MIEAEEAFVDNLESILKTMESFLKGITQKVIEKCSKDLENILKYNDENISKHFNQIEKILKKDFIRLPYNEAMNLIKQQDCFKTQTEGLTKEHELFLVKHFDCPVFVIDWPTNQKPFYMKSLPNNQELVI